MELIQKLKGSAKIVCMTDIIDPYDIYANNKQKYKNIYITITAKTREMAIKIFDEIEDRMGFDFCRCPSIDQIDDKWIYCDTIPMEFEYGTMTEQFKDLKTEFKKAKRELGIK